MSWARDEWKQDLPTTALKKINELESETENLRKNKQQQQFQLESVSAVLQKQKQLNAEEKAANASLRRELQAMSRKCSELESQEEKLQVDLKNRENKIELSEEQLRKMRAKLKEEEEKNSALILELDQKQLQVDGNETKIGQLSDELEKALCAKAQATKELEAATEKITALRKENDVLREQLHERDDVLTNLSGNANIENETVANAAEQETGAIASAFVEILKRENNALLSENEKLNLRIENMKGTLREKERELERVMGKLAETHAQSENALQNLQSKELEIGKLKDELGKKEGKVKQVQTQAQILQGKNKQLFEEIECDKRIAVETEGTMASLTTALEDAKNTIEALQAEMKKKDAQVKMKNSRIESLEKENADLNRELDTLKRQNKAAKESYATMSKELRSREIRINGLENELKNKEKLVREQVEKIERLLSENEGLKEELAHAQQNLTSTKQSYRSVSRALEVSQIAATKEEQAGTEQADDCEDLGQDALQDGEQTSNKQSGKVKKTAPCPNCDYWKSKFSEQAVHFQSKIRELQTTVRELKSEKEVLEETVVRQRRNSEALANQVEEMVQSKLGKKTEAGERQRKRKYLQEKENLFGVLERFFQQHEDLKQHALSCLHDIQEVQRYFHRCADGAKNLTNGAHAQSFQGAMARMSLLRSLLESVVEEFAQPVKMEATESGGKYANDDSPYNGNIRDDMSWDDYEREAAFQSFKGGVDDVLQELHDIKWTEKKAEERREVTRAHLALKKVRRKSRRALDETLSKLDEEDLLEKSLAQNVPTGSGKENALDRHENEDLKDVLKSLLKKNREELELRMDEQFRRLENTITRQKVYKNAPVDERRQRKVSLDKKDTMEGMYAIEELDIVKRKLSDVQSTLRHLIDSLADTDHERKNAESKISLLSDEMCRKESHFEARCEEFTRAAKVASEQQISLRSCIDTLSSEKDELHGQLRKIYDELKQKELDLVAKAQQIKHLQNEQKEDERMAKNKIASLEQENEGLWMDYKEASKRAESKEMEFKQLAERLKCSQGYLQSLFTSLSNIDDELQRARDIEIFSARD